MSNLAKSIEWIAENFNMVTAVIGGATVALGLFAAAVWVTNIVY